MNNRVFGQNKIHSNYQARSIVALGIFEAKLNDNIDEIGTKNSVVGPHWQETRWTK